MDDDETPQSTVPAAWPANGLAAAGGGAQTAADPVPSAWPANGLEATGADPFAFPADA